MAEFIAQEEMDRDTGYWWSPDERHIALARVDESPVAEVERFEIQATGARVVRQRYPATGARNARVDLFVADLARRQPAHARPRRERDIYLPRVDWFPDGRGLAVQRQSRDQKTLELLRFDALTGRAACCSPSAATPGCRCIATSCSCRSRRSSSGPRARRIPASLSVWQRRQARPPAHVGRIHGGGRSRPTRRFAPSTSARAACFSWRTCRVADRAAALLGLARSPAAKPRRVTPGRGLAQRLDVARTRACSWIRFPTPTRRRASRCAASAARRWRCCCPTSSMPRIRMRRTWTNTCARNSARSPPRDGQATAIQTAEAAQARAGQKLPGARRRVRRARRAAGDATRGAACSINISCSTATSCSRSTIAAAACAARKFETALGLRMGGSRGAGPGERASNSCAACRSSMRNASASSAGATAAT